MENMRLRCHFSIIFESLWSFWLAIFIFVFNGIGDMVDMIREAGKEGIMVFIETGAIWGILFLVVISLIVFTVQFLRWRKTWITLEDNLVIVEKNTLNRKRNTIAIENISAVNMERNLFQRIVGTYRIKIDTNSATTANETDVSIVFRQDVAIKFRKILLERMNALKGNGDEKALSQERQPDELTGASADGRMVFTYTAFDMIKYCFYCMPMFSLFVSIAGIGGAAWYITSFGWNSFIDEALGGFIAVVFMVLSSLYNLIKAFFKYYGLTVYRDGKDIHVKCGLLKLRSYTIPVDKITALSIEQPFMSRIFRKYHIEVEAVGIGDEDGESSNLTMALSREDVMIHLETLVPELCWGNVLQLEKEDKMGGTVRMVRSVKWHVTAIVAVILLNLYTDLPWWISYGLPLICDLLFCFLYAMAHKTAGYSLREEGVVLSVGTMARHYTLCAYEKIQTFEMKYYLITAKKGIGDGYISMLNTGARIPFINKEVADEIAARILGGKK